MILNSEIFDYTAEIYGGGYKVTSSYVGRKEDKCSPSFNEGWCQAR